MQQGLFIQKMYSSETLSIPPESHSSVSSINILITTQHYLLGVKKKAFSVCSLNDL